MAYGEKHFLTWFDCGGTEHESKFLQEGGSGTTRIYQAQPVPYTLTRRGGKKVQTKSVILGSEAKINFIIESSDLATFEAILESDYKEWKVEH